MFSVIDRDFWFKEKQIEKVMVRPIKKIKKIHCTHAACPVNTQQQFITKNKNKKQASIQTSAEHC